jgi:membrane protein
MALFTLPYPVKMLVQGVKRFGRHQQSVVAGHLAYSLMLSMLPFLIFATALTGTLVGDAETKAALDTMFEALPEHVARTLEPVVREVTSRPQGGILTIAALGTIWAASNGVEAVRIGLNRAYEDDIERHFVLSRLVSILVVILGFLTFVLLGVLIIFAPLAFRIAQDVMGVDVPRSADIARHIVGFGLLFGFLWVVHRLLPARKMKGFSLWPGILTSVLLWIIVASGLSFYLSNVQDYTITYGTLAGVIVTLLFLFLTGAVLMLGAEVNAAVNARRMRRREETGGMLEGPLTPAERLGADRRQE